MQAKKDLSSHCDQIVMSLATLNKQRSVEKQSIRTTVTISKVSKTPILTTTTAPIMSQSSRKIALDGVSETSTESPQTVREKSKSPDEVSSDVNMPAFEVVTRKKEFAKEKFFSSSIEENAAEQRRGMLANQYYKHLHILDVECL